MCIWISKNPDVLAIHLTVPAAQWIAAALLLGVCYWTFRAGTPRRTA
jgi:hypothetical protein